MHDSHLRGGPWDVFHLRTEVLGPGEGGGVAGPNPPVWEIDSVEEEVQLPGEKAVTRGGAECTVVRR